MAHAHSVDRLDEEATLEAAQTDPSLVLEGEEPHLVDEWQEVPGVWDAARRHVDDNANRKGQLILTGSSKPKDEDKIRHSGTGRIAQLRMWPMSLAESGDSTGAVSLAKLFDGDFEPTRRKTEVEDIARWCCRGGWPSNLGVEDEFALETPSEYVRSVLDVSIPKSGKSPETARALMRALAMNVAQAPTYGTLARDMAYGDEGRVPADETVKSYMEELKKLYLLNDLEGWAPPLRAKTRVRTKPKRYFVDPSLAAAMIGASPATLMRDTQTLGDLFETLCMRDLHVYMSSMPGATSRVMYYRDDKGLEVDVILELADGRWGALEIKLSDLKATDVAADKLKTFVKKVCGNPLAQVREPEFLGFLVGRGDIAYRRNDGILVIPIATLGA
ncbi:ATPase AAA [Bifidobacterium sp. DSM 109957]|uniref:ATPase AAA n=2 Tax=Bifidobacterium oedipodis TaxID=2675322 RepID=A0A7Y0EQZ0_9BIFI|nr:ATPase AAA [Bifidobacterium sp. DSM 109957]